MKRNVFWLVLILAGLLPSRQTLAAQDLQALAARQELEDFIRATNTRLRDLEEAVQLQQKRILSLEDENRALRGEVTRLKNVDDGSEDLDRAVTQLDAKIEDVDRRRISDNKLIVEKLRELKTGIVNEIKATPAPAPPPPRRTENKPDIDPNAELFEYQIQSGDNLYKVQKSLKSQGMDVAIEDIQKANPKVDWRRLQIGQTILIPIPKN
jgi:hypothetical protein